MESETKSLEERIEKVHTVAKNVAKMTDAIYKRMENTEAGELFIGMYYFPYAIVDTIGEKGRKEISMGTKRFQLDDLKRFAEAYVKTIEEAKDSYNLRKKST